MPIWGFEGAGTTLELMGVNTATLGIACDQALHNDTFGYTSDSWFLSNQSTVDFYRVPYAVQTAGFGLNKTPFELFCGYVRVTADGDSDEWYQLFTEAALTVYDRNGILSSVGFYAINLGPRFRKSNFTAAEIATYPKVDNAFGWLHDWDFTHHTWRLNRIGPDDPSTKEYSFDPAKFRMTLGALLNDIDDVADYCVPTGTGDYDGYCARGDNWGYQFSALGLNGDLTVSSPDLSTFDTYEVP